MTTAKLELFDNKLQKTAAFCKALGHPARLAILKYLAETNVCMSGDITKEVPLSRTTVNQHLKELKDLNLIKGEIEGARTNYCLNPQIIHEFQEIIQDFFKDLNISDLFNDQSC